MLLHINTLTPNLCRPQYLECSEYNEVINKKAAILILEVSYRASFEAATTVYGSQCER